MRARGRVPLILGAWLLSVLPGHAGAENDRYTSPGGEFSISMAGQGRRFAVVSEQRLSDRVIVEFGLRPQPIGLKLIEGIDIEWLELNSSVGRSDLEGVARSMVQDFVSARFGEEHFRILADATSLENDPPFFKFIAAGTIATESARLEGAVVDLEDRLALICLFDAPHQGGRASVDAIDDGFLRWATSIKREK